MLLQVLERHIIRKDEVLLMACERIDFLGVPLDILKKEDIENEILRLLNEHKPVQIIFLSTWDVLRARRKGEFQDMVTSSALCLPISKSIIKGASFLKKSIPERHYPFETIISILNVINSHSKSLYMLGATKRSLAIAEDNVKSTFKELKFVGRYNGYYKANMEPSIISAIAKAAPSFVILGNGIKGGARWIYRNKSKLSNGIYIYDNNIIDIFSKYKKKTSNFLFRHGLEYLPQVFCNPLKIFTVFKYCWFKILLIFYRIRNK